MRVRVRVRVDRFCVVRHLLVLLDPGSGFGLLLLLRLMDVNETE